MIAQQSERPARQLVAPFDGLVRIGGRTEGDVLALERLPAQLLSQYVQQVGLDEQPCAEVLLCALVGNDPVLHREAEAALVDTTPVRVERPLEVGHALHPIDRRFAGNLDVLRPRAHPAY